MFVYCCKKFRETLSYWNPGSHFMNDSVLLQTTHSNLSSLLKPLTTEAWRIYNNSAGANDMIALAVIRLKLPPNAGVDNADLLRMLLLRSQQTTAMAARLHQAVWDLAQCSLWNGDPALLTHWGWTNVRCLSHAGFSEQAGLSDENYTFPFTQLRFERL